MYVIAYSYAMTWYLGMPTEVTRESLDGVILNCEKYAPLLPVSIAVLWKKQAEVVKLKEMLLLVYGEDVWLVNDQIKCKRSSKKYVQMSNLHKKKKKSKQEEQECKKSFQKRSIKNS